MALYSWFCCMMHSWNNISRTKDVVNEIYQQNTYTAEDADC